MKNIVKGFSAAAIALLALSASSRAQTVQMNAAGSSALFLELGEAAASSNGLAASCLWSTSTNGTVVATDSSLVASGGSAMTDTGSAWVAWTPGTSGCSSVSTSTQIYAYLSTDSVVGNRCLFNGCTVANSAAANTASANLILGSGNEQPLPAGIISALNASTANVVNVAGTDIRPEDAEFAMNRALTPCGQGMATGSQYLGLGYTAGTTIDSYFSTSTFNVLPFTLPSSYSVTPLGATPVVVVVNGDGTNLNISNITSTALAKFLDGSYSYAGQALATPAASGAATKVIIREPISGTYNTMEYNVPNTTVNQTSQEVGNCNGTGVSTNPMNLVASNGGTRQRAIGTGQELSEVLANTDSIGYGFWSVGNFKAFNTSTYPYAKYVTVDSIDPLLSTSALYNTYHGVLPLTGSAELSHVNMANVTNGTYPIWSMQRLVNLGSTASLTVTTLVNAAQSFVASGTTTSTPDFVPVANITVVRSHFLPPVATGTDTGYVPTNGTGEPTTAANGHGSDSSSSCTATEAGGDVGGVVLSASADSSYCSAHGVTVGQTGQRR